jgi:hypothetical protein
MCLGPKAFVMNLKTQETQEFLSSHQVQGSINQISLDRSGQLAAFACLKGRLQAGTSWMLIQDVETGQTIRKIDELKQQNPSLSWCRSICAPYLIVSSGLEKGSLSLQDIR